MDRSALIIGNSDGIGLALTSELVRTGWKVTGISRSGSQVESGLYTHFRADVRDERYRSLLARVLEDGIPELCVYCAGIGELLDLSDMSAETEIFEVNLMGMVKTVSLVIPPMAARGSGHFIGLSSLADRLISPEAPSYHASKAGFSSYLESLALALKARGVAVTNVRFGFVDTKMARADVRPFMMSTSDAVSHLLGCIEKKPARLSAPRIAVPLVGFRDMMLRMKLR